MLLVACGQARDASDEAGGNQIEYVPLGINWVKKYVKDEDPANRDAQARDLARKIADEMLSRMQASAEPLDAIAESVISAKLGPKAVNDPKRRKMVTVPASKAGEADLPPDAKEALAAFARKAKPGDVVDSPLGSGPVLVVARAAKPEK